MFLRNKIKTLIQIETSRTDDARRKGIFNPMLNRFSQSGTQSPQATVAQGARQHDRTPSAPVRRNVGSGGSARSTGWLSTAITMQT